MGPPFLRGTFYQWKNVRLRRGRGLLTLVMVRPEDLGPENLAEQGGAMSTATQSPSCLGLDVLYPVGHVSGDHGGHLVNLSVSATKTFPIIFEMSGFVFPEAKTLSP